MIYFTLIAILLSILLLRLKEDATAHFLVIALAEVSILIFITLLYQHGFMQHPKMLVYNPIRAINDVYMGPVTKINPESDIIVLYRFGCEDCIDFWQKNKNKRNDWTWLPDMDLRAEKIYQNAIVETNNLPAIYIKSENKIIEPPIIIETDNLPAKNTRM